MSLFITQCPHCHTSFRTSVSQLQSADGMVRCGACLRVFAADDNLLPSADIRTINLPVQEEIEEEEFEELDEQLPISELEIEDEDNPQEEETDSIFTLDLADSVPNRVSPSISTDEPLWELVEEENTPEEITEDEATEDEDLPDNIEPEEETDEPEEALVEPNETLEEALEELPLEPEPEEPKTAPPAPQDEAQIRSRMTAIDFDDDILNDNSDTSSFTRFSAEEIEGVSEAETPLELDWQENTGRGRSTAILWLLALLLVLGIAGQYLWFNRDSLSQNASVRPILNGFCNALRCELPALVNIRAIRSDTLVVRSHDEVANALTVNFQFRNDADFAQPFPGLALLFMDANDALVAQRRFAPEEYLPEGVANLHLMPPGAPVQVRLDILDPGGKAVNYELSFYAIRAD